MTDRTETTLSNWWTGPLAGFDLETTGQDPLTARSVSVSVVIDEPGKDPVVHDWLVAVEEQIPPEATEVHGITTERAQADGRPFAEVITEVTALLVAVWHQCVPVVVFNAPYDLTLLNAERSRFGARALKFDAAGTPLIDPLVIDRAVDRFRRGSRKLEAMAAHYGVVLERAHSSDADALAAVGVARALPVRWPRLRVTPGSLFVSQRTWQQLWAENFESYRRGQLRQEGASEMEVNQVVIDRSWPVRVLGEPASMRVGGRQR